jgi:urease accessory protein
LGTRLASVKAKVEVTPTNIALTTQRIHFSVGTNSALFLLPEPVTCFRDASYNQIQTFDLTGTATVVVLDWITSGRKTRGEDWAFSRYYSANEITVDGKEVAKDILLLDDETLDFQIPLPRRSMATRLAPYSCYATVILYGPQVRENISTLNAQYDMLSVFKTKAPTDLIWSFSPIDTKKEGAVVRVAGKDTEAVRLWLRQALKGLEPSIGIDVFRAAFP